MKTSLVLLLAIIFTLTGCGNDDDDSNDNLSTLDCTGATAFDSVSAGLIAPQITLPTATSKNTTIVLMHGKTGQPNASHLASIQTDLAALGYKVIAPSMSWSTTTWHGSLCESMAYINEVADAEIAASQDVVLLGHSMGGAYALMYSVTQPSSNIKAIVTIAPGHFMHESNLLQSTTAADVIRANQLVASNQGDALDNFVTLNNGTEQSLATTANRYLSFHDLDRVPGIRDYAASISTPVLWLSGSSDSLTTEQDHAGLANLITSTGSNYQVITGDHLSIVASTPSTIDSWLTGL